METKNTIAFKVLIVGEPSVGKTSFGRRYATGEFTGQYKTTIGVDFATKLIQWDPDTEISINIWDLAGQERLNSQSRVYYRGADGAMCVYDASRMETLKQAELWLQSIMEKSTDKHGTQNYPPCILIGNKMDLLKGRPEHDNLTEARFDPIVDHQITEFETSFSREEKTEDVCKRFTPRVEHIAKVLKFTTGVPVSVSENIGIDEAMKTLIMKMMERKMEIGKTPVEDLNIVSVDANGTSAPPAGSYCSRC